MSKSFLTASHSGILVVSTVGRRQSMPTMDQIQLSFMIQELMDLKAQVKRQEQEIQTLRTEVGIFSYIVVQGLWFVLECCFRGREGRSFEKYYTGKTEPVLTERPLCRCAFLFVKRFNLWRRKN